MAPPVRHPLWPGQRFGGWTVLDPARRRGAVTCRCECGAVRAVLVHNLISGGSQSCGHPRPQRPRRLLAVAGEQATFGEWSRRSGISAGTIRMRVTCYGWPAERAVTEPPQRGR